MNTTDATLEQQASHAAPEPAPAAWIALTAGDTRLAQDADELPVHDWPGTLFIRVSRLAAAGMGLTALGVVLGMVLDTGPFSGELWMVGLLATGAVLQGTLARSVERFTRWGWYAAVAELSFAALAKAAAVVADPGSFIGAGFGIAVDLLWLQYFWARRRDFDVDLDR